MNLSEYARYDAVGLADLIARKEVTAAEVQDAACRAIGEVNPRLNAVVGDLFAEPLACDNSGRFRGVPFAIKDLVVHAAGVPTEMGSRLARGLVFPHDSHLMARYRKAGLATMCRTTTPEFGFNATTEAVVYGGPTRNPWNLERSPGGSSGGSAALVSARALPIAHANDGGGSIRIPAAACGLVGLKPTRGRTPVGPDYGDPLFGLGIEFGVARTVRDVAALLDCVEGPEPGDRFAIARPTRPYAEEVGAEPGRLRVALATAPWSGVPVDPACADATRATARLLEQLGHQVTEARPEINADHLDTLNLRLWCTFLAQGAYGLGAMLGREVSADTLEATVLRCAELGRSFTIFDLAEADAYANELTRACGGFFTQYDLLVTPTAAQPPLPLGWLDANDPSLDADGWLRKVFAYAAFTPLFNVSGQPAISLPLGSTPDGLPVGVQLVARYGEEDLLLRVAAQLETAQPWISRIPPVRVG